MNMKITASIDGMPRSSGTKWNVNPVINVGQMNISEVLQELSGM